jgi:hypothetical protein
MDITPDFSKLLKANGCAVGKHGLDIETVEGFLKEAYRIVRNHHTAKLAS